MNRSYKVLPVYSGDVSGAASALYELGGMMVIHDPSGCNSTYNTHDEVRWNEMESLIFISGLTDRDAITGNDEKFIEDIVAASSEFSPAFIAIANSPIPYINGTDFNYIAKEVMKRSGIKTFAIATNAFHDYTVGASNAFKTALQYLTIPKKVDDEKIRINILGTTPLDFTTRDSIKSLKDILAKEGFVINSNLGFESSLREVLNAANAHVNVVVSSCGKKAAEFMYETYGIPYVVGCPIGKYGLKVNENIRKCFETKENIIFDDNNIIFDNNNIVSNDNKKIFSEDEKDSPENVIIGEIVTSISLANALFLETGKRFKVCITTEEGKEYINNYGRICIGEEAVKKYVENAKRIIADPMYKKIASQNAKFIENPHFAFSGRMYLHDMKNIFEMDLDI